MEVQIKDGNRVDISVKKATFSFLMDGELDTKIPKARVILLPVSRSGSNNSMQEDVLIIDGPGEYELEDTSIHGIRVGQDENYYTIYRITGPDGASVLVLPKIKADWLNDEVVEVIDGIDVLCLPVTDVDDEYNPVETAKVVRRVGPHVLLPVVSEKTSKQSIEQFNSEVGGLQHDEINSFKTKNLASLPEGMNVYRLSAV